MKKTFMNPFVRAGKTILTIAALPFMLAGILMWAVATLGRVAVETMIKKKPATRFN